MAIEYEQEPVDVNVVAKGEKYGTVVVEFTDAGQPRRTVVPATVVRDGKISLDDLASGTPYGEPWEYMVMVRMVTPLMYANALRRRGIWTKEDLLSNPAKAMAAIQEVHGVELSHLLTAVKGR